MNSIERVFAMAVVVLLAMLFFGIIARSLIAMCGGGA